MSAFRKLAGYLEAFRTWIVEECRVDDWEGDL